MGAAACTALVLVLLLQMLQDAPSRERRGAVAGWRDTRGTHHESTRESSVEMWNSQLVRFADYMLVHRRIQGLVQAGYSTGMVLSADYSLYFGTEKYRA